MTRQVEGNRPSSGMSSVAFGRGIVCICCPVKQAVQLDVRSWHSNRNLGSQGLEGSPCQRSIPVAVRFRNTLMRQTTLPWLILLSTLTVPVGIVSTQAQKNPEPVVSVSDDPN